VDFDEFLTWELTCRENLVSQARVIHRMPIPLRWWFWRSHLRMRKEWLAARKVQYSLLVTSERWEARFAILSHLN
jgi:hypothetical protein